MQATVSLLVLYTFTLAVAAVGVPVEFILADGALLLSHTLESSDFEVISDMVGTITTKEEIESSGKPIQITLNMIEDENMLRQLKRFWCEEVPEGMEDIGPEQFSRFIQASNYLLMHGETSMRFARNMAKAALLGRHSSAIVKTFPYPNPLNGWNITWQMFIGFAAQTDCEVRVSNVGGEVTLCSAGDSGAETYGVPASKFKEIPEIKKLTIRCDVLGNTSNGGRLNVSNRMGILTWFLCHLGVPSLSMGSEFELTLEDIQCFSQAIFCIKHLEQAKKLGKALILEELDLSKTQPLDSQAIEALIPGLPSSLKELWINIDNTSFSLKAASVFKRCEGLEKLHLPQSLYLDSETIEALISNLPSSLKELQINVFILTPQDADAFKGCDKLEKLVITEFWHDSSFIEALIPNLPSLKELQINVFSLTPSAADAFKGCDKLEKLVITGFDQNSSFIEALVPNLPSIKELQIKVWNLTPSAGHAFKGCDKLEKLVITGFWQYSSFIEALIPNLPSLKELQIKVVSLTPSAADAFKGCDKLEKLVITGFWQYRSFIEALIPNLPSIKELDIKAESLTPSAADAFKGCDKLEKLDVYGDEQNSSFIEALVPNLPSLKELQIKVGSVTSSAGDAFKGCKGLEKLTISGRLMSGFFKHILSHPLTDSLRVLRIYKSQESQDPSDKDNQAMAAARERSIQIDILEQ